MLGQGGGGGGREEDPEAGLRATGYGLRGTLLGDPVPEAVARSLEPVAASLYFLRTATTTFGTGQARPASVAPGARSNRPVRSTSRPPPRAKSCASGPPSTYIARVSSIGASSSAFTRSWTGHGVRAWKNRTRPFASTPIAAAEKRRSDGAHTLRRSQEIIRMDCTSVP